MRQVLGPGVLGRPRGIGWRGRWEGGLGWGIHVTPWLIHVNVWQNRLKCCEVISLQLIKIHGKKKKIDEYFILTLWPTYLTPRYYQIKMKTFVHSNLCVGLAKNFVRVKTQTFWPIKYDLFSYYWVLRVFLYILNISSFIRYMTYKYFLSIYSLYSHSPNSVFFKEKKFKVLKSNLYQFVPLQILLFRSSKKSLLYPCSHRFFSIFNFKFYFTEV